MSRLILMEVEDMEMVDRINVAIAMFNSDASTEKRIDVIQHTTLIVGE